MSRPVIAYIALGANLNHPIQQVLHGIERLRTLPQSRLLAASSLWRTAPVGVVNQPDYINAVAAIETTLSGGALLGFLQVMEREAGRLRENGEAMAARPLDLDLLLCGDEVCSDPTLTLPHPRMHQRAFVLAPLCEIAPQLDLPGHGRAADCLSRIQDQAIERLATPASARLDHND